MAQIKHRTLWGSLRGHSSRSSKGAHVAESNKNAHLQPRFCFVECIFLSPPSTPVNAAVVVIVIETFFLIFRLPLELGDPLLNLVNH